MYLHDLLRNHASEAIKNLFEVIIEPSEIQLQETKKAFEGDQTIVIFPLLKTLNTKPEEAGNSIGQYLVDQVKEITDFSVVKGFLNLTIHDQFWVDFVREMCQNNDLTIEANPNPQKIMVEYSSPNSNKPLHLGHIRNNLLGYSISEILKARGHDVIKANLINDRGINVCKSMIAYLKYGNNETPENTGEKGDHFVGKFYTLFDEAYSKEMETMAHQGATVEEAKQNAPILLEAQQLLQRWENGDPEVLELWRTMNNWVYKGFEETYKHMGVDFDQYYYESDTYLKGRDIVIKGLEDGIFYKKEDGSVWVDLVDEGLDEKLLLRSDGTSVYMTQDIGTAEKKFEDYQMDQSMYIVGNEQDYHFNVLKLVLQKLNKTYANGVVHVPYGMVDLPTGKMKSREGTVVDADDLMEQMEATAQEQTEASGKLEGITSIELQNLYRQIGLGALKFYILKTEPQKNILFKPEESIDFQGATGPFIQYSYARIKSIMRKAESKGVSINGSFDHDQVALNEEEKELIRSLYRFNGQLANAERGYAPSLIADYGFNLAKLFNKFYHEHTILGEEDENTLQFRIALAWDVALTIKKSMELLGIEVPERM